MVKRNGGITKIMKIITAKYFSQHASEIGKYLYSNPRDYYYVTNKTNPKKNFICCKPEFIISGGNSKNILAMALATKKFKVERSARSRKMSLKHWNSGKIKSNENNKKPVEKIRSILYDNDNITSIARNNTGPTNMEVPRGRRTRMVYKIYD